MTVEQAKLAVMRAIDEATVGLGRPDYREFLDWLESEAQCRRMALDDDDVDEAEDES